MAASRNQVQHTSPTHRRGMAATATAFNPATVARGVQLIHWMVESTSLPCLPEERLVIPRRRAKAAGRFPSSYILGKAPNPSGFHLFESRFPMSDTCPFYDPTVHASVLMAFDFYPSMSGCATLRPRPFSWRASSPCPWILAGPPTRVDRFRRLGRCFH